jgi:hypothetical protein
VNLAVPGYNTAQEMLTLKEKGLAYRPDLVIVNFVLNDDGRMVQLVPRASRLPSGLRKLLKRSDLVQSVYAFVKQANIARQGGAFREVDKYSDFVAGAPGWEAARSALEEIHRMTSASHASLLVVVWPMFINLGPDYPHRQKHELVVGACRELGIPVLDLLPTFEGKEPSVLWAAYNDHHPNGTALAMGAEAVVNDLAAEHLLPAVVAQR